MEREKTDQERFDEQVSRNGKVVLQAIAGVAILGAFIMSMVALMQSSEKSSAGTQAPVAKTVAAATPAKAAVPAATKTVSLSIIGSVKKGPDGKMHDAFTVTNFNVKVGQPLKLKINNTDDVPHSISSPVAGVNITAAPGTHTYTLQVSKAGKFQWNCDLPCDGDAAGWAMSHPGFMSGYITAT